MGFTVFYILSHPSKLKYNYFPLVLQAFSRPSRDLLLQCILVSFQAVLSFFFNVCMCVRAALPLGQTEKNLHFLSPARTTLPGCHHCLKGEGDVGDAALRHPHIYFSSSESPRKQSKSQSITFFSSGGADPMQMKCLFVFTISILLLNEPI